MNVKPGSFKISGPVNLVKAISEEMKEMGYIIMKEEDPDKTWNYISNNFTKAEDHLHWKEIFISQGSWEVKTSVNFTLPNDWEKALTYVKEGMQYWKDQEEKKNSKVIYIGSNNVEIIVHKSGGVHYTQGNNTGLTSVQDIKNLFSHFWKPNKLINKYSADIDENIRFIRIGCPQENNLFSIADLRKVVETWNNL